MINVTCTNCGWVHMGLTREYAQAEVDRFNEFYDAAAPEVQENYAGRSTIEGYEGCFRCGKNDFRPSKDDDCPRGCTIQPTIYEPVLGRQ